MAFARLAASLAGETDATKFLPQWGPVAPQSDDQMLATLQRIAQRKG